MVGTTTFISISTSQNNSLDEAQEKLTTVDLVYIATWQSCTTDMSRAKLQRGRMGSSSGDKRLSATAELHAGAVSPSSDLQS